MFIQIKELPELIQAALKSVSYGTLDIEVCQADSYSIASHANDGQRGFIIAVNTLTGETKAIKGSWGGSNAFTVNQVNDDTQNRELPTGMVIIKGCEGYPKTFAHILVNSITGFLPTQSESDLSETEKKVLAIYDSYKAFARKEYISKVTNTPELIISGLVAKGYLKMNKAGATSITTKGKNGCYGVKTPY